jgi:hypothetical protein
MRSSLEGALATLEKVTSGNFDSPFEHGSTLNRPSKPKVEPFKKLDSIPLSARSYR